MSNDVHEGIDQVQETPFATKGFSRLSLLAGTAGLTIGGVLSAPAALAQQDRAAGPKAHHGPSATMSDRIYSVNPSHPQMTDIAENPANVPPPINRNEPAILTESWQKLIDERAEYIVFNGHVGALTEHYPLQARVGETVRIYFGVGGPNYMSSFHVIGEIFDRVYLEGSLVSPPIESVQTIKVAPKGSGIGEFKCEVPGRYVLVDHALSRVERGLAGYLFVEGEENPEIFTSPDVDPE